MSNIYSTIAVCSAPKGAVVIYFGEDDEPWCHSTPCYGIAIEAEHEHNVRTLELGKRMINERASPIVHSEFGLGPEELDSQMMLVTPQTTMREICSRVSECSFVSKDCYEAVLAMVINELERIGIRPQ